VERAAAEAEAQAVPLPAVAGPASVRRTE